MTERHTIYLTPPRIGPAHIRAKIVCIRAHRERIFQVNTTHHGTQLICNNYGHGGAGWTFLFGCVNESVRLYNQQCHERPALIQEPIAVIGAGCHALLSAIMLARQGRTVRLIAEQTTDIPSYKAAGFFFPRSRTCSNEQERALFERLGMESYTTYCRIARHEHPFIAQGAHLLPAYYGLDIDPGFAPYIEQGLMSPPEPVRIDFGNGKQYNVMEYMTLFIDATRMMAELNDELAILQIPIMHQTVTDFAQLPEQVIFNCAGRGAGPLAGDKRMVPVQGHLIALEHQPDMSQLRYMINVKVTMRDAQGRTRDELIYYAPKDEGILGITFIRGQDCPTANPHEFDRLLQRSIDFFGEPSIN
ncbi:MAG: FAD-binding oxidoreductase [Epsilonproteobacteria bacterium]|nr:FAD-binding oxidoreductase [Campylobacterota bacterium]